MRHLSLLFALVAFIGLAFASNPNGTYKGTWTSDNQGGGDLTMSFSGDSGSLKAEVSFTNEGETIKCDVKSVKFAGSKLLLVMDYGEGDRYEASLSGVLHGNVLSGTYNTKSLADDSPGDTGTWKSTKESGN
ncbi:MAG: hypothetical protein ACRD6B_15775 [Bryobacteraceae bacterium]